METGIPLVAKVAVAILCVLAIVAIAAYDKVLELLRRATKSVFVSFTRRGKKGT